MAINLNPNTPKFDNDPLIPIRAHLPCKYPTPCNPPSRSEFESLGGMALDAAVEEINLANLHAKNDMLKFRTQARLMRRIEKECQSLFDEVIEFGVNALLAVNAGDATVEEAIATFKEKADTRARNAIEFVQTKLLMFAHLEYWSNTFPEIPVREGKTRIALIQGQSKSSEIWSTSGDPLIGKAFHNSEWRGGWDRWCVPECYLCGQRLDCGERLDYLHDDINIDHITPKSKGGTNEFYNLALTHKSCNTAKGDLSAGEYMMKTKWAKDKTNCSRCRKLLPRDEMECCVPPRKWSDKVRQMSQPFYYYCADCLIQRKWQQPSSRLCVCENPDHHNNPPTHW